MSTMENSTDKKDKLPVPAATNEAKTSTNFSQRDAKRNYIEKKFYIKS